MGDDDIQICEKGGKPYKRNIWGKIGNEYFGTPKLGPKASSGGKVNITKVSS
ncbi:MAG: hypothetical protein ACTSQI_22275 [Candidatus Helarchaeota archaeon]